jgi:hypothetical protein
VPDRLSNTVLRFNQAPNGLQIVKVGEAKADVSLSRDSNGTLSSLTRDQVTGGQGSTKDGSGKRTILTKAEVERMIADAERYRARRSCRQDNIQVCTRDISLLVSPKVLSDSEMFDFEKLNQASDSATLEDMQG